MRSISVAAVTLLVFVLLVLAGAQTPVAPGPAQLPDFSGMYSFVKEGEFMQITLEEKGKVTGFISRYGDSENNKGTFLDQFIKSGSWNGQQVSFTTDGVHGVTYSFEGAFERGPGKKPEDEGYYLLRGTLSRNTALPGGQAKEEKRDVEFRSFPRDADAPQ